MIMKKQIETNKHRIFFYGTLIPVLAMFGYLYSEYRDQQKIIAKTHDTCNRVLELQAEFYNK